MWTLRLRVGLPEVGTALTVLALAAIVAGAISAGWIIAVVPAVTYTLGVGVAYGVYRHYTAERVRSERLQQPGAQAFRIVGARGSCLLGRRVGELLVAGGAGSVEPEVCPHAAAVLKTAAADGREGVEEWCCPVYDHLLVFRRERQAA